MEKPKPIVALKTTENPANTYKEIQESLYKRYNLERDVLGQTLENERVGKMKEVFQKIGENGNMKIVESDTTGRDGTDVIVRKFVNNKLSGNTGVRLSHGTDVQLVGRGMYKYGEGSDGRKHIYVQIKTSDNQIGWVASEHLSIIEELPPPEAPNPPRRKPPKNAPLPAPVDVPKTTPKNAPLPAPNADLAKETLKSVKIDSPITYGEFAKKNNTTVAVLNGINSLNLLESTILPKGSEVYVPVFKKPKSDTSSVPNPGTDGETDKKGERIVNALALSEKILAKLDKTPAEKTALQKWLNEKSSDLKGRPYGPNTTQITLLDFLSQQQESIKNITVDTTKNNITVTLSNGEPVTFAP